MAKPVNNLYGNYPMTVPLGAETDISSRWRQRLNQASAEKGAVGGGAGGAGSQASLFNQAKNIARRIKGAGEEAAQSSTGAATDQMAKMASTKLMNFLWGLMATVVGALIAFFALNIIALLKALGFLKHIKLRLIDKVGIAFMDLVVGAIIIFSLSMIAIIVNFLAGSIWDQIKWVWDVAIGGLSGLNWGMVNILLDFFKGAIIK